MKNFQSVDVTSSHHGKLFEFVQFGVSSLEEIGIQEKFPQKLKWQSDDNFADDKCCGAGVT